MDAADINTPQLTVKNWLNGGMVVGDLATDGWCTAKYIYGPEFFGTPAPMVRMTFGDFFWRERGDDWNMAHHQHSEFRKDDDNADGVAIDGLTATISLEQTSDVRVSACFFAWTNKGDGSAGSDGVEETKLVEFDLWWFEEIASSSGTVAACKRSLYGSGATSAGPLDYWSSSKQFHMTYTFARLPKGVYHFAVRSTLLVDGPSKYKNLFVVSRNFNVKCFPKVA